VNTNDKGNSVYVYGVTAFPFEPRSLGQGIGDPPADIFLSRYKQLAAVVSRVKSSPDLQGPALRQNLMAHADVVNRVFQKGTILPVAFGCVCPLTWLRKQLLMNSYDWLLDLLNELDGKVELRLSARYREEPLLKAVIKSEPWLAHNEYLSYADKIQRGKEVLEAIERRRDTGKRQLFGRLGPLLHDFVVNEENSPMSFGASLLVNRKDLAQLDHVLDEFARDTHELDFKYVGPLAPYSFVRDVLRVSQEAAWV
jgi:hypothetical protein